LNEATWLIVFGLGIDIIGVYFVLRPLLYLYKRYWGDEKPDLESKASRFLGNYDAKIVNEQNTIQSEVRIGFTLLVIGFVMQIIGNSIQSPPL